MQKQRTNSMLDAVLMASICLVAAAAQAAELPDTPEAVLQAALETYGKGSLRTQLTARHCHSQQPSSLPQSWFNQMQGSVAESMQKIVDDEDLNRGKGNLWSVAGVAQPGDVVHVTWQNGETTAGMTMVYVGEESYADLPNRKFSFFIFPYRSRLEFNTLPPRIHRQYAQFVEGQSELNKLRFANTRFTDRDERHDVEWIRPSATNRKVFFTSAVFNGSGRYSVYRAKANDDDGQFQNFDHKDLVDLPHDIKAAWQRAVALNERCQAALQSPSSATRNLLQKAFSIDQAQSEQQAIAAIRENLRRSRDFLKQATHRYVPEEAIIPAADAVAAADGEKNLVYVRKAFFEQEEADAFVVCGGSLELMQSSTLLHEAIHPFHPFTEAQAGSSFKGHWGGIPDRAKIKLPQPLGLAYQDAVRNPYAYQYFAIWLTQTQP